MPARVMESAQHAVRASHQHHGRASHQERQGAPRLSDLDLEPGEKPAPLEDGLQVEGERIGVVVEGLREAVAGPARPHQGFDLEFLEHASPRSMCDAAAIRLRRVAAAAPTISRSVRTGRPSGGPTQTDGSPVRTGLPTRLGSVHWPTSPKHAAARHTLILHDVFSKRFFVFPRWPFQCRLSDL